LSDDHVALNKNNDDDRRYNGSKEGRRRMDLLDIDINAVNDGYHQRKYNRERDCIESTTKNGNDQEDSDFQFGDTTYRHDGFSIGKDYLRCDGKTITRGEILSKSLVIGELLGEGNFSRVHKAMWTTITTTSAKYREADDQNVEENKNNCSIFPAEEINNECKDKQNTIIPVAVKQCSVFDISDERKKMLIKELRTLCQLQLEALVGFHGAFLQNDNVVLVMEYMDSGSLEQWRENKNRNNNDGPSLQPSSIDEAFFSSVAYQVLCGLEYLHSQRILHRDIKPGNILLNTNGAVKLCDFGIVSLYGEDDQSLQTTIVGTSRFMSPERLRGKSYGKASDIWSLGLVVLELWKGEIPFQDCESIVSLVITVEETTLDDLIPSESVQSTNLRDVLRGCLQQIPSKRMPASVLRQAPWFTIQHHIITIEHARILMLEVRAKQNLN